MTCPDDGQNNYEEATLLQHMLMTFGYVMTEKAFEMIRKVDTIFIDTYSKDIEALLEEMIGTKRGKVLSELYPQMLAGEVTTSIRSFLDLLWNPEKGTTPVEAVYNHTVFNKIDFCTEEQFKDIFTSLVQINTVLTGKDFETVEWFAKEYGDDNNMPDIIPFKENLCLLAALKMKVPVKTSTDVLRIAVYLSTGSTNLALPPKMIRTCSWSSRKEENPEYDKARFCKFNRAGRRYLLSLLEEVADVSEMVLRRGRWIRLGEILHPGDYAKAYPKAFKAFNKLRNEKVTSWYSALNKCFDNSLKAGISFLQQRPGEYARRIDALLRHYPEDTNKVLAGFREIASKISSKVLWELYTHFSNRDTMQEYRSIQVRGARARTMLPTLEPFSQKLVDDVQRTILMSFADRFEKLEDLGAVWIDEDLKKIPAPTNMDTLNDTLNVTVRGTRMPLSADKKLFRPYIYWTAGVDLDLSMTFVGPNAKAGNRKTAVCSYSSTTPFDGVKHSGDVIPRTKGEWREYIDVNLDNIPYKYGVMTVRNFEGGSLDAVGAIVGIAEFDRATSGNEWLAKAVKNSFKMTSKGGNLVLLAIDFTTREWILIDEDQEGIPVEVRQDMTKYITYALEDPKLSAYHILKMHAEARGKVVTEVEDADTIFKFEDFSTSYEKIAVYML